jgi:hypothetical protein
VTLSEKCIKISEIFFIGLERLCHGLDKLWKWNVCVCVNICMNDYALRAVKKLYIRLCAARDSLGNLGFVFNACAMQMSCDNALPIGLGTEVCWREGFSVNHIRV